MVTKARIAVVDDEEDLRGAVCGYLVRHGFEAVECPGGEAVDAVMREAPVDLVLLDVNMPGEDGFAIARRLRSQGAVGIIMLTARADLIDRVVGLELGADDYITKPFELREVVARITAVLRRTEARRDEPASEQSPTWFSILWVQDRGMLVRVAVCDLEFIEADRDYVLLHAGSRVYSLRATMDDLQKQLDPAVMLRVHRSTFVPPSAIASYRRQGRGGRVQLHNGRIIAVGPAYLGAVAEALRLA